MARHSLDHKDRTRGRGRLEVRCLKTVAFRHFDYPDARQALRWGKGLTSKKITIERLYFVTSLPPGAATDEQFADWIQGRWKIEN
ncbi:hypothetical protein [Streptomyces sp. NPDC005009]